MGIRDEKAMVDAADPGWLRFWAAFPKRVSKKEARIAWEQLKPTSAQVDHMLATLAWQETSRDWQREGGRFIPYPASWLRGQRWEDEPTAPPSPLSSEVADPMQQWLQQKASDQ